MSPTQELTNYLGCRISTDDRLKAEALKSQYNVRNNSELLRVLIQERAEELGV